jgi:hypothetical protein
MKISNTPFSWSRIFLEAKGKENPDHVGGGWDD